MWSRKELQWRLEVPRPSIYPFLDPLVWDHIPLFEGTRRALIVPLCTCRTPPGFFLGLGRHASAAGSAGRRRTLGERRGIGVRISCRLRVFRVWGLGFRV